jgi:ribulose-phosphate 3-epimerase
MIKLAPSILSADFNLLGHQLDIVAQGGADYVHIDVMDGHFVPNISMGFPIIQSLRKQSSLVFDVHLMVDNPKAFVSRFAQAGADIITFHVEVCDSPDEVYEIIGMIRGAGKKAGLALRPDTPLQRILEFVTHLDMILIMSVMPGFGGQEFIAESLDRARDLREYAADSGHNLDIEMDGGINFTNVRQVIESGVNVVVVGSAIFDRTNIHAATKKFKGIFNDYKKTKTIIVIFANGEVDNLDFFKQVSQNADLIICCDGGANVASKIGLVPHLIVGDFDSLDTHVKAAYENEDVTFSEFPAEKNATDLELAVDLALGKSPDEIVILGGYGGRADHFLGNIQTLVMAAKADVKAFMVSAATKMFVIDKFAEIPREFYDHISLVPLEAKVSGITTTGLKYPLCDATLHIGNTVGISNEFVDFVATVTVDSGLLLAICTKV